MPAMSVVSETRGWLSEIEEIRNALDSGWWVLHADGSSIGACDCPGLQATLITFGHKQLE